MDALHGFHFEGLPVHGRLLRLDEGWRELLARHAHQPYAPPVRELLGQMTAAAVLLRSNIKFDGSLLLQVHGDGPVKLAVAEVRDGLGFRATATVSGEVADDAALNTLVDVHGHGRCSITLDPGRDRPGQQPYQGVVPLRVPAGQPLRQLAPLLEHYMRQSEQLETRLLLAAGAHTAAGLLLQRLPGAGVEARGAARYDEAFGHDEDFNRIAHLMATLTHDELLQLDAHTVLHRLFWQERVQAHALRRPRFACSCARERVRDMLRALGPHEVQGIVVERGEVEVGCEFCGQRYRFDAVDVGGLFTPQRDLSAAPGSLQ
ncbi:MAG TPA: Hsp33 family molecular chaperone HslO [Rubrivivax sp.]|nr:Hsp33 family molecular chaperone HslO [Rubrivivax sp.]